MVLRKPDGETLTHELASQQEWDRFKLKAGVVAEVTTSGKIESVKPAN